MKRFWILSIVLLKTFWGYSQIDSTAVADTLLIDFLGKETYSRIASTEKIEAFVLSPHASDSTQNVLKSYPIVEKYVLDTNQVEEIKKLLLAPENHAISPLVKYCEFVPDFGLKLYTKTDSSVTIIISKSCEEWVFFGESSIPRGDDCLPIQKLTTLKDNLKKGDSEYFKYIFDVINYINLLGKFH